MKHLDEMIDNLRSTGVDITEDQANLLKKQIERDFSYVPRIGIFGKTGSGKSSLFNAIYGENLCDVSDVEACTAKLQEADAGGVVLVDCPGLAESEAKDKTYKDLYMKLIPTLDAIFWVLKGDDRAYQPDLEFYNTIGDKLIRKDGSRAPFFFVLNQVDKIEPFREWNEVEHRPGQKQGENIKRKIDYVASVFNVAPLKIIDVSATEKYNLVTLMNNLLAELPDIQSLIVYKDLADKEAKNKKDAAPLITEQPTIHETIDKKIARWAETIKTCIEVGKTVVKIVKGVREFIKIFKK